MLPCLLRPPPRRLALTWKTPTAASAATRQQTQKFYTEDSPGIQISPEVVLMMSGVFVACVTVLHILGKLTS